MRDILYRLSNVFMYVRLLIGLIFLPINLARGLYKKKFKIISFDIFGTLIERTADEHYAWRAGAIRTCETARCYGLEVPSDVEVLRRAIESEIAKSLFLKGRDPEFKNRQVIEAMLRHLGAGEWAVEAASEIADWELQQEIYFTKPRNDIVLFMNKLSRAGNYIIAISDTRYSASELKKLFLAHGINNKLKIYSSADLGVNKLSGRLFDEVSNQENTKKSDIFHIGDNLKSDILSASQRGLAVRWTKRPPVPPALPEADYIGDCNPAFRFGYESIGPIIVGFTRLLFDKARADSINHLAFVARDGYLLHEVAQILNRKLSHSQPSLSYLHLSRRAVAPASPELDQLISDHAARRRFAAYIGSLSGDSNMIRRLQNYFGFIDEELFNLSIELGFIKGDQDELRDFLGCNAALVKIRDLTEPLKLKLKKYLMQEGVFSSSTALVDIGWRGTIHNAVQHMALKSESSAPRAYYFGYWNIVGDDRSQIYRYGIIGDQRRSKNILEASPWQCVSVLESVCRADHGMVNGFLESDDGLILPQHVQSGTARSAESRSIPSQKNIREGVLAYARWFAEKMPVSYPQTVRIRHQVQRRLIGLAFFPKPVELEVGRLLTHSDPTDDHWALPLIVDPSGGFKGWVSGIRSPWKGGYFRAYGGLMVAAAYFGVEAIFSYASNDTKLAVGRWVLRRKLS